MMRTFNYRIALAIVTDDIIENATLVGETVSDELKNIFQIVNNGKFMVGKNLKICNNYFLWAVALISIFILAGIILWNWNKKEVLFRTLTEKSVETNNISEDSLMPVKIFVSHLKHSEDERAGNCQKIGVYPLTRYINKSSSTEEDVLQTLDELWKGVTLEEKMDRFHLFNGFPNSIGVEDHKKKMIEKGLDISAFEQGRGNWIIKVKSLEIEDSIAYLDFNLAINVGSETTYGCTVNPFRMSVINTLKQFSEIDDVVITAEGKRFPCLGSNCVKRQEYEIGRTKVFLENVGVGEGITHLSRRALGKYLKQRSYLEELELTVEQQIFIEDHIQNRLGSEQLNIDDTIEISSDLIEEAIEISRFVDLQAVRKYILPASVRADVILDSDKTGVFVYVQYLDQKNTIIKNAKITIEAESEMLDSGILSNPYTWVYEAEFSEKDNYYFYHYLVGEGAVEENVCFKVIATAEAYLSQYKKLQCVQLYENLGI